jgi:hypothetical protein
MRIRLVYFVICLTLVNCKEEQPKLVFKYADKPQVVNCDGLDTALFNEALYTFESRIFENYAQNSPNLSYTYRLFLRESTNNTADYNNLSNQHSLNVFKALRNTKGLWVEKNNTISLNYKHDIFSCIGNNIQDKDLKTTYNALLSTNSMSIRMLKDVLIAKSSRLNTDKYLATYVALELYYSKLSNVDLSKKDISQPEDIKREEEKDAHAGHNHS